METKDNKEVVNQISPGAFLVELIVRLALGCAVIFGIVWVALAIFPPAALLVLAVIWVMRDLTGGK